MQVEDDDMVAGQRQAPSIRQLPRLGGVAPGDRGQLLPRLEVGRDPALEVGGAAPLVGRDDHERELARTPPGGRFRLAGRNWARAEARLRRFRRECNVESEI